MNFYLSSLDLRKGIIRSVIAVLLGIVFLIAPDLLPNTLVIILGATVLFVGIVSFLTIFTKDGGKPAGINYFNLVLSLIVGIVLLIFPDFFVALLMYFGGTVVTVIIVIAGLAALIHSNITYKEKNDNTRGDKEFQEILKISDRSQVWKPFLKYVSENDKAFLDEMTAQYTAVTDGLMQENVKTLRRSMKELKNYKMKLKNLRKKETICLRMVDPATALEKSAWFHTAFNYMEQVYYSLRRICEPAYEHVDNNFSPIPDEYCKSFTAVRDELISTVSCLAMHFKDRNYEEMRAQEEALARLQGKFSDLRKVLTVDIQEKNLNLTVAYMYLNLVQESEQLCISLKHYARASRKLA